MTEALLDSEQAGQLDLPARSCARGANVVVVGIINRNKYSFKVYFFFVNQKSLVGRLVN